MPQHKLPNGQLEHITVDKLLSAEAAARAHDAQLREWRRQGLLTPDEVNSRLNFAVEEGELVVPRSRVRGVHFERDTRLWTVRPVLPGGVRAPRWYSSPSQQAAEVAAVRVYRMPGVMPRAVELLGGSASQQRRTLGSVEVAELAVALSLRMPVAAEEQQTPLPEEEIAAQGLDSPRRHLRPEQDLQQRLAQHERRHESLCGTRPGVMREPHMPVEHLLLGLTPEQAVVVLHRRSGQLGAPLFPCCHLDHRRPLAWADGRLSAAEACSLDCLDPMDGWGSRAAGDVRVGWTGDGCGG